MGNILTPLPLFTLPNNLPWTIRFVEAVDHQLGLLRSTGHFQAPRFFGYYLRGGLLIGVAGAWTVDLDVKAREVLHLEQLARLTGIPHSIESLSRGINPAFILVHDRRDGSCYLSMFHDGLRFIEAVEPYVDGRDLESGLNSL